MKPSIRKQHPVTKSEIVESGNRRINIVRCQWCGATVSTTEL